MSGQTTDGRRALIDALLHNDDLRARYERSGAFYHGINRIAAFAAWAVDGLAAESDATDAKFEEHRRLMERAGCSRCARPAVWQEKNEPWSGYCSAHAHTANPKAVLVETPGRAPVESVVDTRPMMCSEPTCYRAPVWERIERGELHEVFCHPHAADRGVSDLIPIPGHGPA